MLKSPGFLHPLIHLGFGIEFKQPAIIAEALAQAAVHDDWITPYLFNTEKASTEQTIKTLLELLDEIRASPELSTAAHWSDANKSKLELLPLNLQINSSFYFLYKNRTLISQFVTVSWSAPQMP